MHILHCGDEARGRAWQAAVAQALPDVRFSCWPDVENAASIRHVVAWTLSEKSPYFWYGGRRKSIAHLLHHHPMTLH